MEELCEQRKLD